MAVKTWADLSLSPNIHLVSAVDFAAPNVHGVVDISPETLVWLSASVKSLVNFLGDKEITTVTVNDIDRWQKHEAGRGIKAVTANSYLRGIKTLYGRLLKNGVARENPAQPIRPLVQEQPNPKAISKNDYLLMRGAASCSRDLAIIDTLWSTGCRVGGLIGMKLPKLESFVIDGQTCYAADVLEKGGRQRMVYWKSDQADSLTTWLEERPLTTTPQLFTTQWNKQFTRNGFSSLMRNLRLAAGIEGRPCNPHAFRHAFAIRKLDEGYDIATVSQWMGHSSPEFTAKIYCVRSEKELRSRFFSEPIHSTKKQ